MTERSTQLHDNNIYSYVVLCDRRQIVLHTEFKEVTPAVYADVIFSGVVAHNFEDVLAGNIVFQIDEVDVEAIVKEWSDLFAQRKNYGWPDDIVYSDPSNLVAILKQRGIKAFEISSSYGLFGWVFAERMEVRQREQRFKYATA